MRAPLIAILLLVSAGAACGSNDSQTTTAPATTATATETFVGLVGVQGSSFFSFTVIGSGTVKITLASLMPNTTGAAANAVMGLGLGNPVGTGCALKSSINAAPALTAQLTSDVTPDIYCAEIHDVGNLTVPLNFTLRVVHP